MSQVFIGRQPIFDRDMDVYAYDLLYRDGARDGGAIEDADLATSRLLLGTFLDIGLEKLVGSRPACFRLSSGFLRGERPVPMSPEQAILEVGRGVRPDPDIIAGVEQLRAHGFDILLRDIAVEGRPNPLLGLARFVKLTAGLYTREQLMGRVSLARAHGAAVIAERVETHEQLEFCREAGCDYFQGFFLSRPQLVKGAALPSNRLVILQLIARLRDPDVTPDELDRVIVQDITLSYALLRYINCAAYAVRREVNSVRQAILLLGTRAIRNWATFLLMRSTHSGKPTELMVTALVRARMCELLAIRAGESAEEGFTVGLLSLLDAVMDTPMEDLLDSVSLSTPIKLALAAREGGLGRILEQVLAYEQGRFEQLDPAEGPLLTESYLAAVEWAEQSQPALARTG